MKKNRNKRDSRYSQKKEKEKKKGNESKYQGFNTLREVAGLPKSHAFHSNIPISSAKTVKEPLLICPDCGERIQSIAEAISLPSGEYVHFDCMLDCLKKSEVLNENESISYIGRGKFAVVEKDSDGKYTIKKTIEVEDEKRFQSMKEYVEGLKI